MKFLGVAVSAVVFGVCVAQPVRAQDGSGPPTSEFPPAEAEGSPQSAPKDGGETTPQETEAQGAATATEGKAADGKATDGSAAREQPVNEAPAEATEEELERFTNDAEDVDYAAAAEDDSRQEGERRGGWYIGFDIGSGWASITSGGTDTLDWSDIFDGADSTRMSLAFEVGGTLGRKWLLGGRYSAIREVARFGGESVALQHGQYLVNLTGFPLESGEGPFVRVGGGLSALTAETSLLGDASLKGFGVAVGAGYAFWLGDSFNLTLSYDFNASLFEGDENNGEATSGTFQTLQLGFYWY